jgi:carbamate kinase
VRAVVALGGNALARRGDPMSAEYLRGNLRSTCQALAGLSRTHEMVITYGNGPQIGLLALQNLAYRDVGAYPLDILGAETQGMLGYVVQQELSNAVKGEREVASVITTTLVDESDLAFERPTKLIGPQYTADAAAEAAAQYRWTIAKDGDAFRRVVPSPTPKSIVQARLIRRLLDEGTLVVCVGGGGVPVRADSKGHHVGVQAVVDKDLASAVLAREIGADLLIMLTDGDYVSENWGSPQQREILAASPDALELIAFAEGSMRPKVEAAMQVARAGGRALIGPLERLDDLLARKVGTEVVPMLDTGIVYVTPEVAA